MADPTPQSYVQREPMKVTAMPWCPDDPAARGALVGWLASLGVEFDLDLKTRTGEPATLKIGGHPVVVAGPGWWIVRNDSDGSTFPLASGRFHGFYELQEEGQDPARDALVALLGEILREFTQRGHPGRPALRTGWVWEETANGWRARLAELTPPAAAEPVVESGGCPATVWDGPYAMCCGRGAKGGVCAVHGRFRPAAEPTPPPDPPAP